MEENTKPMERQRREEVESNSKDIWVTYYVPQPSSNALKGKILILKQIYQNKFLMTVCSMIVIFPILNL